MAGDGLQELVPADRQELRIGHGLDRRGAGNVPEESDLAEELARAELAGLGAVHGHLEPARLDHVEAVTGVALANDLGPGGDVDRYRREGEVGLEDRSSAPSLVPSRTPADRERLILFLRELRFTSPEIAETLAWEEASVEKIIRRYVERGAAIKARIEKLKAK